MDGKTLQELKRVNIKEVNPEELVDISEIEIDMKQSVQKRVKEYVEQVHNPYLVRVGEYVVKIGYSDCKETLNDRMKQYISKIAETKYVETEKALTRQEDMLKKLFYNGVQSGVKLERLKETMQITTLDRDTLLAFVDRIEVYEEKKVSVQFCCQEEMEKMLVLSEFLSSQSEIVKEVV